MNDFRLATRFVFPFWKRYWKFELVLTLLLGIRFLAQMQIPVAFQFVIDSIISLPLRRMFIQALAAFCGLLLVTIAVSWAFQVLVTWVGERLNIDITSRAYDHVLRQRRSFWERFYPNDVLTRLTQDIAAVKSFAFDISHDLVFQAAVLLGTLVVLLTMSRSVGELVACYVPLVFLATYAGNGYLHATAVRLQALRSSATQVFGEGIRQPWVTLSWGLGRVHLGRYRDVARQAKREQLSLANRVQLVNGTIALLNLLVGSGAVLWIMRSAYQEGKLSTGTLVALIMYAGQATQSTVALAAAVTSGKLSRISVIRVSELLAFRQRAAGGIDPADAPVLHPHFRGSLAGGIRIPVGGPFPHFLRAENGAGKTTFAHLLAGFDDLAGSVIADKWFLIPSVQSLFPGTLIENLRIIAGRDVSEEEATHLLEEFRLEALLSVFPDGFSTVMAENAEKISLGQKQAAVLIGAVLSNPPRIIVDEGLNSLEADVKVRLRAGLLAWLERRRSIVIEHDGYLSGSHDAAHCRDYR